MADLKSVRLFEGLSDKELKAVERDLREVRHPAGKEILVRGENGVGFAVITEGQARVTLADGRQRELGQGDSFGEMALLDHEGRSATVTAVTDLRVLSIPEWNFKAFLAEHPEVAWRLLQVLSRRVRQAEGAG